MPRSPAHLLLAIQPFIGGRRGSTQPACQPGWDPARCCSRSGCAARLSSRHLCSRLLQHLRLLLLCLLVLLLPPGRLRCCSCRNCSCRLRARCSGCWSGCWRCCNRCRHWLLLRLLPALRRPKINRH